MGLRRQSRLRPTRFRDHFAGRVAAMLRLPWAPRGDGPDMQIHLAKTDITTMSVDAVVNPANSLGIMGGGVAAALSRKGGPTIQKEAMSMAPIAVGAAVVTNAGTLWAKHVIHAPTMDQLGIKVGVED